MWLFCAVLLAGLLLTTGLAAPDDATITGECRNLFVFAKFVRWPDGKFPKDDDTLRVGFIGSGAVRARFEETSTRGGPDQRKIVVVEVSSAAELKNCHILFVESERSNLKDLLAEARKYNVLTVGMSDHFLMLGGMVNYYLSGGTVRFEINNDIIRRTRLILSSRMLSLARIVDSSGNVVSPDARLTRPE